MTRNFFRKGQADLNADYSKQCEVPRSTRVMKVQTLKGMWFCYEVSKLPIEFPLVTRAWKENHRLTPRNEEKSLTSRRDMNPRPSNQITLFAIHTIANSACDLIRRWWVHTPPRSKMFLCFSVSNLWFPFQGLVGRAKFNGAFPYFIGLSHTQLKILAPISLFQSKISRSVHCLVRNASIKSPFVNRR